MLKTLSVISKILLNIFYELSIFVAESFEYNFRDTLMAD